MRIAIKWKIRAVLAALVLTLVVSEKQIERLGDTYQIALPVIALGCAITNGQVLDYSLRYTSQWLVVQGSKHLLGKTAINQRPNGKYKGMPSGHTATAVFGASHIARSCVGGNVWVKSVVYLTAGFVGASRIEAQAHDIWQVLIGALVGLAGDRAFRRVSPAGLWRRQKRRWRGDRKA